MADTATIIKDIVLGVAGCAGLWQFLQRKLDIGADARKRKDEAEAAEKAKATSVEKERRRQLTEEGMMSLHAVADIIQHDFNKNGAERVILFSGHNCGGIPSPAKPYYVTAMQWYAKQPKSADVIEDYRRIRVDPAYIKMLYSICCSEQAEEPNEPGWHFRRNDRAIVLKSADMRPCQLKTYYEHEGVTNSVIIFLGNNDYNIYYISIARYEGEFTEQEIAGILLSANRVSQEVMKW